MTNFTAQKMKFPLKNFFRKCEQICRKLGIWSHLLKESLMENFIFCGFLRARLSKHFRDHLKKQSTQGFFSDKVDAFF